MNCQLSNRLLAAKERETQELVGKVDSNEKKSNFSAFAVRTA